MSTYFLAQIRINDEEEYDKYLARCDEVFSKFNGRYLAVDDSPKLLEGEWDYTKTVLIEFDTEKDLMDWYSSDEYQSILAHRLGGASCDTIMIKGK